MQRPLWFKRKLYGWGWYPATWQGWAIIGVYTGGVISIVRKFGNSPPSTSEAIASFYLPLIGLTLILLVITLLTGEKPRWQWGRDKDA